MAIRFQCGSCAQPIEVDDEWMSRAVVCPYCRTTVTAPEESTLTDPDQSPLATPLGPTEPIPGAAKAPQADEVAPAPSRNRAAVAALVAASTLLLLLVVYVSILSAHQLEIEEAMGNPTQLREAVESLNDYIAARDGEIPSWMFSLIGAQLGAGVAWIASVICGVLGMRVAYRRSWAIAALIMAGLAPVVFCCGGGV